MLPLLWAKRLGAQPIVEINSIRLQARERLAHDRHRLPAAEESIRGIFIVLSIGGIEDPLIGSRKGLDYLTPATGASLSGLD
jgi:hypothetical protein